MKNILTPAIPAPQTRSRAPSTPAAFRAICAKSPPSNVKRRRRIRIGRALATRQRHRSRASTRAFAFALVASLSLNYSATDSRAAISIQEGNVGLMKAVKRFDPNKGARLATFASYWIRAECTSSFCATGASSKSPRPKRNANCFSNCARFWLTSARTNRRRRSRGAARSQKIRCARNARALRRRRCAVGGAKCARRRRSDGANRFAGDARSHAEERLFARFDRGQTKRALAAAIDALDPRSREIVRARRLREPPATLHQLAAHWGVSAERVRQIEARALTDMAKTARRALAA